MIKKVLTIVIVLAILAAAGWLAKDHLFNATPPAVRQFHADADKLIQGLQQYREFVGSYPSGTPSEIGRALAGQTDKKVVIIATRESAKNDKGEITDPWGTPVMFFFTHNGVMIRSAGPNKVFEDSRTPNSDDLYRSEIK